MRVRFIMLGMIVVLLMFGFLSGVRAPTVSDTHLECLTEANVQEIVREMYSMANLDKVQFTMEDLERAGL